MPGHLCKSGTKGRCGANDSIQGRTLLWKPPATYAACKKKRKRRRRRRRDMTMSFPTSFPPDVLVTIPRVPL